MSLDDGVKEYLRSLQASIDSQETTIACLRAKNKRLEEKLSSADSYNEELRLKIDELSKEVTRLKGDLKGANKTIQGLQSMPRGSGESVAEEMTRVADQVVHEQFLQGMSYEETSGLYYDFKTGLYYDATKRMYYDGEKGTYLVFNEATNEYEPEGGVKSDSSSEEQVLSEGEVSSPSPPPPDDSSNRRPKKLKKIRDDPRAEKKRRKKEMKIPCIRLVVHSVSDEAETVNVGTLFIVTCKGATIGREGNHDVLLEDVACSKYHGKIEFDEYDCKYYLTDLGSQNGTFVDGKRLSSAKRESLPQEIGHGSLVRIGSTQMICHIHPGSETCYKCEPGVIIAAQPKPANAPTKVEREEKRKSELKQLRKKYGIGNREGLEESTAKGNYADRAEDRRKTKGSDNPYEKTVIASTEQAIPKKNKGFKMLEKMGWKDGVGLGKDNSGRVEPVNVEQRAERSGLGAQFSVPAVPQAVLAKATVMRKTQERFNKLA